MNLTVPENPVFNGLFKPMYQENKVLVYLITPVANITINNVAINIKNNFPTGAVKVGIYSAAGSRIDQCATITTDNNPGQKLAAFGAGVDLVAGTNYYVAIAASDTNILLYAFPAHDESLNAINAFDAKVIGYAANLLAYSSGWTLPATLGTVTKATTANIPLMALGNIA